MTHEVGPGPQDRLNLPYLDGLRGAAALIIVAYHAFLFTGHTGDAESAMPIWSTIIGYGYTGVAVFIVLSGYVLMLPVIRADELTLRGGNWGFIKRRARRILPPYYAALAFTLILILTVPAMHVASGTAWDSKLPVTWQSTLAHVFMVHDLSPAWILAINGPMWSVAVEWQIYFVMALVLLPLWRRVRPAWILAALLVVTVLPIVFGVGTSVHPWFLVLFAAGMWSAQLTLSGSSTRGFGIAAIVLAVLMLVAAQAVSSTADVHNGVVETLAGLSVASALVWIGRREVSGRPTTAGQFFKSRPMMFIGLISYSVYLFHSPLLALVNLLTLPLALPAVGQYVVLTFVGIPFAVAVSFAMFWLVERHFLNSHQRGARAELQADAAAQAVVGRSESIA